MLCIKMEMTNLSISTLIPNMASPVASEVFILVLTDTPFTSDLMVCLQEDFSLSFLLSFSFIHWMTHPSPLCFTVIFSSRHFSAMTLDFLNCWISSSSSWTLLSDSCQSALALRRAGALFNLTSSSFLHLMSLICSTKATDHTCVLCWVENAHIYQCILLW